MCDFMEKSFWCPTQSFAYFRSLPGGIMRSSCSLSHAFSKNVHRSLFLYCLSRRSAPTVTVFINRYRSTHAGTSICRQTPILISCPNGSCPNGLVVVQFLGRTMKHAFELIIVATTGMKMFESTSRSRAYSTLLISLLFSPAYVIGYFWCGFLRPSKLLKSSQWIWLKERPHSSYHFSQNSCHGSVLSDDCV